MKYENALRFLILLGFFFTMQKNVATGQEKNDSWKKELNEQLQLLGHRNWILVVDAAYPLQSNPAIKTVATGADHLSVINEVLTAVGKTEHVAPQIYLDKELDFVPEEEAPGISNYRAELDKLIQATAINKKMHEDIIYMIDEAAETFSVLVLKTNFTIPYTSVFINLNCGYWTPEQDDKLRRLMRN